MHSTALPKNLKDWLSRPPKQRKGAHRGRVKKVSAKRQREGRIYTVRRRAFLAANPWCQAWATIARFVPNSGAPQNWPCATEIHHMKKPRATYLNDESTWLAVSRWSHDFIENNKSIARQLGLLA